MKKIIYPGTFDPIHYGHIDIAKRASKLFDEVHICISDNLEKNPLFTHDERVSMIEECLDDISNISVHSNPKNLVVNFARDCGAVAIIRGLRHVSDFEFEFQMANVNYGINPSISTLLMIPDEKFLLRRVTPLESRNLASFVMFVVLPVTGVISSQRTTTESSTFEWYSQKFVPSLNV